MNKFDSTQYWIDRYKNGGDSGKGSYGIFGKLKSEFLNNFIERYEIKNVLELGCGEGDHLKNIPSSVEYLGHDVSDLIVKKNRKQFPNLKFTSSKNIKGKFDLTLSMDVILHLIDDEVYKDYMKNLFSKSKKYVIIYDADQDTTSFKMAPHNKYRKFTKDIPEEFKLISKFENPHKGENTKADFYVFRKNTDN